MLNVEESFAQLGEALNKVFNFTLPESKDEGDHLLTDISVCFARHFYYSTFVANVTMVGSKLADEMASIFSNHGHSDMFQMLKTMSAKLLSYEYAEQSDSDQKPENEEAEYLFNRFLEEGTPDLEDTIRDAVEFCGRDHVLQISRAKNVSRFIIIQSVISQSCVIKAAMGNRKQYNELMHSIVFSD